MYVRLVAAHAILLYTVHSLATLTTCAIELLSTSFVPRFVHSLFALEFPPSKLQRTCALPYFEEKLQERIVYLELFNKFATDHIYRKGCFNFQKEMSKTACLEFLANRPL